MEGIFRAEDMADPLGEDTEGEEVTGDPQRTNELLENEGGSTGVMHPHTI